MTGVRSQKGLGIVFQGSFCIWRNCMGENKLVCSSIDQQLEKLKQQGLIISNEDFAKTQLRLYGYSNLIKSYRDPYTYVENGHKIYRSGITFEQVVSLFTLDKNLRNAVMGAMLDLEEHVKEAVADVIAQKFGCHQDDYLKFRNYSDKKKRKPQFTLSAILTKMQKALNSTKNPIAHYQEAYGVVPPWILFKSIYFSDIINFTYLLKPAEQSAVATRLYDNTKLKLPTQSLNFLMMDTLYICLEYRNLAAHGGRIYNYLCNSRLRFMNSENDDVHGFSQLLFLLHIFRDQIPYEHLNKVLSHQLNRHCNLFPEDTTYLSQILNINIKQRHPVWIAAKGNKYHLDQYCCGIKNPHEMDLEAAKKTGFIPCKKCCK